MRLSGEHGVQIDGRVRGLPFLRLGSRLHLLISCIVNSRIHDSIVNIIISSKAYD